MIAATKAAPADRAGEAEQAGEGDGVVERDQRHDVAADAEEGGVAETQNAGAAPEEVEARREQAEDQRIADHRQLIAVGEERIDDGERHADSEDQQPVAVPGDHRDAPLNRPLGRSRTATMAASSTMACASDGEIW